MYLELLPNFVVCIILLIVSLVIGSFLNVVIHRLPLGESVIYPPSHCPHCQQRLGIKDLVPLLSYGLLRGHCRYCGEKISTRYPLVEGITAVTFLLGYWQYGFSLETLAVWLLTGVLITTAFIDIDHGIIPNKITYPVLLIGLVSASWTIGLKSALMGVFIFAGILFLTALFSRGGMGGGDVKLAAVIGAFSGGAGAVVGLFITSIIGGIWAVILLLTRRAGRKTAIRFGPFLAIGGWIGALYGEQLLNWYLSWLVG